MSNPLMNNKPPYKVNTKDDVQRAMSKRLGRFPLSTAIYSILKSNVAIIFSKKTFKEISARKPNNSEKEDIAIAISRPQKDEPID